jgi:hypothetical protein
VSGSAQKVASENMSAFSVSGGTCDASCRPSQVVVFDFKSGAINSIIPIKFGTTVGQFRADELCYNPTYGVVLIANDEPGDNFITFIDAKSHKIIQIIKFDGTDPNGNYILANGLEQCQFNPRDDNFYFNIPNSNANPPNNTKTGGHVLRISPSSTNPLQFQIEADWNTADIKTCKPAGLAVGPAGQLGLGCGGTDGLIISDGTGATAGGSTIAILKSGGGIDEDWYNPGNNHYYFGNSNPGLLKAADAGNLGTAACSGAGCPAADAAVKSGSGSHSVAADSVSNNVFVPIRAGSGTVCSDLGGSTATGCIAVYQGTNDDDDISAGKKPITGN